MPMRSTTAPTRGDTSTRFFKTLIGTTSIAAPKRCAGAKAKNDGFRRPEFSSRFSKDDRIVYNRSRLFRHRLVSRAGLRRRRDAVHIVQPCDEQLIDPFAVHVHHFKA